MCVCVYVIGVATHASVDRDAYAPVSNQNNRLRNIVDSLLGCVHVSVVHERQREERDSGERKCVCACVCVCVCVT